MNQSLSTRRNQVAEWFRSLQEHICKELEAEDTVGKFHEDRWERPGGGGGHTRILKGGKVIEKGGVNFSAVYGTPPESTVLHAGLDPATVKEFFATGVSIVLHPSNPLVPIIHMNVRYFDLGESDWWFGGGIDLTPHYVKPEDARFFHTQMKAACDRHDPMYYSTFKQWADDYFFITHRNETRGIGGIFFDYLKATDGFSFDDRFAFVKSVGESFAPTYRELMRRNKEANYHDDHKKWQLLRRGRYVEFNLIYDRGTKFGLESNGRTESILMSLPAHADWEYDYRPAAGSPEEYTWSMLRKGVDWINEG